MPENKTNLEKISSNLTMLKVLVAIAILGVWLILLKL